MQFTKTVRLLSATEKEFDTKNGKKFTRLNLNVLDGRSSFYVSGAVWDDSVSKSKQLCNLSDEITDQFPEISITVRFKPSKNDRYAYAPELIISECSVLD